MNENYLGDRGEIIMLEEIVFSYFNWKKKCNNSIASKEKEQFQIKTLAISHSTAIGIILPSLIRQESSSAVKLSHSHHRLRNQISLVMKFEHSHILPSCKGASIYIFKYIVTVGSVLQTNMNTFDLMTQPFYFYHFLILNATHVFHPNSLQKFSTLIVVVWV